MADLSLSRRSFLKAAGSIAGTSLLPPVALFGPATVARSQEPASRMADPPDYTLTIAVKPIEVAPNRILSVTTYNGQFPGPLLRLKEGQQVTIDIHNQTDRPEQLHWHGQFLSTDMDGAAEEGTPFIAPTAAAAFHLFPTLQDFVSITPTSTPGRT